MHFLIMICVWYIIHTSSLLGSINMLKTQYTDVGLDDIVEHIGASLLIWDITWMVQ